ncbi:hypothetical protein [Psychrobacter sp. KCTC 72983]|uniref:hypothetical protein n=1 Tax=Psychrobacter sp. KCTC 72983 TaxID=2733866 RepID=UPI0016458D1A|nr:hypothetical protein [Psychrobacter sp. KCTC 72983]
MGNSISTTLANNQTPTQNQQATQPTASLSAQNLALQLDDTLSLQMHHTNWLNSLYEAIRKLSNNDNYPRGMVTDLISISQHLVMNFNADASDALEQLRAAKQAPTTQNQQATQPTASLSAQNLALQLDDTLSLQMHHTNWLNSLYEAIRKLSNNDNYPRGMVTDLISISQHLVMNFNADASDALEQLRAAKQVKGGSHE